MKADDFVKIERTDGDTGLIPVRLTLRLDTADVPAGASVVEVAGTESVIAASDAAVATLDVKFPGGKVSVTGTPRGDGSGTFFFSPATFATGADLVFEGADGNRAARQRFDIRVADFGQSNTWVRGELVIAEDI